MADLSIGLLIEHTAALRATAEVVSSLRGVVNAAKLAGDAQEAAGARAVLTFTRARDAQGRFIVGQKQAAEATKAQAEGFGMVETAAGAFHGALTSVAAQFGFMALAQQGIGLLVQSFKDMATGVYDANIALGQQRESLAELAALKGLLGQSTESVRQDLAFRAETLQSAGEARSFQESALNVGQSSIDAKNALTGEITRKGLISQGDYDELMKRAGGFQAVEGGDAAAHGRLAGMLPMLMGRRVNADEAFQKEMQLYNISQLGGASFSSMTGQLAKGSGLTTSHIFKDVADQLALTSMFTLTSEGGGGEMTQQFTRATVGALGKMRGVRGFEGADTEKQAEYLKRIGADSSMDPIQIGKLISGDLEAQRKAQGDKFSSLLYLQSRGYGNQEDVQALIDFSGRYQSGQWQGFEDAAKTMPDAKAVRDQVAARRNADPRLRNRQVEVMKSLADVQLGAGAPEYYQTLMKSAFEQMRGEKKISGEFGDLMKAGWLTGDPLAGSRRSAVEGRARWMLQREARRVGVTDEELMGIRGKTDEERMYNLANLIGEHHGNTLPGLAKMAEAGDKMLRTEKAREDRVKAVRMEPKTALPVGPAAAEPARD